VPPEQIEVNRLVFLINPTIPCASPAPGWPWVTTAQRLAITWHSIATGFAVDDSLGSVYIPIQTTGAPELTITHVGNNAEIIGPIAGSTSFILQTSLTVGRTAHWLTQSTQSGSS
jgi:hypothetical protein